MCCNSATGNINSKIVELLLNNGADVNLLDKVSFLEFYFLMEMFITFNAIIFNLQFSFNFFLFVGCDELTSHGRIIRHRSMDKSHSHRSGRRRRRGGRTGSYSLLIRPAIRRFISIHFPSVSVVETLTSSSVAARQRCRAIDNVDGILKTDSGQGPVASRLPFPTATRSLTVSILSSSLVFHDGHRSQVYQTDASSDEFVPGVRRRRRHSYSSPPNAKTSDLIKPITFFLFHFHTHNSSRERDGQQS